MQNDKTILIFPWSQKLSNGKENAKNYPWWPELVALLKNQGYHIIQVGLKGDKEIGANEFKINLSLNEIRSLINNVFIFISIDSFVSHFAHYYNLKPGIIIFSKSDPLIFGYPKNVNLLKNRKYLKQDQFRWWKDEPHDPDAFILPEAILQEINKKSQEKSQSKGAAMFCEICGQVIVLKEMSQVLIKYDKEGEEHVQHVECLHKKEADKKTEPNVLE